VYTRTHLHVVNHLGDARGLRGPQHGHQLPCVLVPQHGSRRRHGSGATTTTTTSGRVTAALFLRDIILRRRLGLAGGGEAVEVLHHAAAVLVQLAMLASAGGLRGVSHPISVVEVTHPAWSVIRRGGRLGILYSRRVLVRQRGLDGVSDMHGGGVGRKALGGWSGRHGCGAGVEVIGRDDGGLRAYDD